MPFDEPVMKILEVIIGIYCVVDEGSKYTLQYMYKNGRRGAIEP
jgi:hypothetical protein